MKASPTQGGPNYQLDLPAQKRRELIAHLNATLGAHREQHLRDCLQHGGLAACQRLADRMDELLKEMVRWVVEEAHLSPADYQRVAIVAQGGYGRRQLNLYSDVDLLLLLPEQSSPVEQAFARSLLYLLWDLSKLDLGHATKTPSEALAVVGKDLDSTTSLMQARLIAGNAEALARVLRELHKRLRGPARKWFIEAKFSELEERHRKYGGSVYLLEPNIKEGEGGLRDVHSLQWLSAVLLGRMDLDILVEKGLLEPHELLVISDGMDFILTIRSLLHHLEGRKADTLSAAKQPEIARTLGYKSDAKLLAEERMMKDYYLRARGIERYANKATRLLTVKARRSVGEVFQVMRRRSVAPDYYSYNGQLFLKRPAAEFFLSDPPRVMECFALAASAGLRLSEELQDLLGLVHIATDTEAFRTSPRCRDAFMHILGLKSGVAATLHQMHETGILGDYFPEFRKLFCLVRVDHYHRYTVDEHLIKTVEVAEELMTRSENQRPELVEAARSIQRWDLLNLALLLHDIGKGEGHGHVLRGAILSQKMTQRMGLPPEDQEVVRQLILQHLKMVHVSQRRDLEDPKVIADMAAAVPDPQLLTMLYILSYADTSAVGPGVWTDWKATLLYDLYRKTMLVLEGKPPIREVDATERANIAVQLREIGGPDFAPEEIEDFLNNVPPKYLNCVAPARMAKHLRMRRQLSDTNRVVWEISQPTGVNYTEITAVAFDVPGLLSYLCGALSSKDINILSVQVYSTKDGYAIDTFQVTDLRGNPLPHGFRLERVRQELNNVLLGKAQVSEVFPHRRRPACVRDDLTNLKPPQVIFDNESSPAYTVLE
ncbi:MAG: [protein-PII] uridylyltransferase, partial [Candidatus Sumerlaea chitinivorans]|nr:[protein-PII] uridylyltransferase [Candidatus Sumerlaea chitinivorans]